MRDTGYFVAPASGPGTGVLLLHSWWGLTPFFRRLADRVSDLGYTVLAPDLNFGETFDDADAAEAHLKQADPDRLAGLTLASVRLIRDKAVDPSKPIGIIGFSMGASLGLWASVRLADSVGAVAAFYGTQSIDFAGADASYQIHLADDDHLVTDDDAVFMEATMGLEDLPVHVYRYPGTGHFFFEQDRAAYDSQAADLAWGRFVPFFGRALG